jgi:hydroxymethylglutaryl-CoA synthase
MLDGLTQEAADETFAAEVGASLLLPSQVGNIYTGSLYLALASLLHAEAAVLEGRRIGLFSYGSGCAAEFFAGRVVPGAAELVRRLDLDAPIRLSQRLSIPGYEALRRADGTADRRPAPRAGAPGRELNGKGVAFLGIDEEERRVYGSA